jgi:membrane protein YdbS with pleckstrin-like domain
MTEPGETELRRSSARPDALESIPDSTASETLSRLDAAVRKVWGIKLAVAGVVVSGAALAYDVVALFEEESALPIGASTLLAICGTLAVSLTVPALRYRFWKYHLSAHELYLERGVVNRVQTIVPLRRIQHLDISQDIVEREFDLARLVVHTAGTRSSDVVLPGLAYAEAERLRDEMKDFIREDTL